MRLQILLALHGSKYTGHPKKCLKLNEISEVLGLAPGSDERLIYHIKQLINAGLVEKVPVRTKSGEWDRYLHYQVTKEWIEVTDDLGITKLVEDYFEKRGYVR